MLLYDNTMYPINYGLLQLPAQQYQPTYTPSRFGVYRSVYNPFQNDYINLSDNAMNFWNKNPEGYELLNKLLNSSPSEFPSQGHHSMLSMLALAGLRNPSGLTITTKKEQE